MWWQLLHCTIALHDSTCWHQDTTPGFQLANFLWRSKEWSLERWPQVTRYLTALVPSLNIIYQCSPEMFSYETEIQWLTRGKYQDIKLIISELLLHQWVQSKTCDIILWCSTRLLKTWITQNDLYTKLIGFNINACYLMQLKF